MTESGKSATMTSEFGRARATTAVLSSILDRLGLRPVPYSHPEAMRVGDGDIKTPEELREGFHDSGLLVYGGHPMLVYIRDHTIMSRLAARIGELHPDQCRKVHFTACEALTKMRSLGRFERYRKTTSDTNRYVIDVVDRSGREVEREARLLPCQYCLQNAQYAGFDRDRMSRQQRMAIVRQFDAKVMFRIMWHHLREYSRDGGRDRFERLAHVSQMFIEQIGALPDATRGTGYGGDWAAISRRYRARMGWRCECCEVALGSRGRMRLLDVHHRNGDKRDNRAENLEAVCKLCHRGRDRHYPVSADSRAEIVEARREQHGIVACGHQ